ncbi:hypothetical protein RYZ79_22550, partial [Escherichia coli]|nr:hypothetical protein [Escherichia coli]
MSSNTFTLGTKSVNRLGYGAMQLAGPGVFGPPRDRHVGNDSNLLIVFYVQIMPDDFVMQLHR